MHDGSISACKLVTVSMWIVSMVMITASWVAWFFDRDLAIMIATTAMLPMTIAAVGQVRIYVGRLCALVRVMGALEPANSQSAQVHSLR